MGNNNKSYDGNDFNDDDFPYCNGKEEIAEKKRERRANRIAEKNRKMDRAKARRVKENEFY